MADGVRLIVGLGNPGARYQAIRHNAGFWFVDEWIARRGLAWKAAARYRGEIAECDGVWLLKPTTFMNLSGLSAAALAGFYKIPLAQILVAHDELDLPPGTARLKQGGGHGGHNGLRSMITELGGADFWRLRIGIGHPGHRDLVTDYVLGKPSADDRELIESAVHRALEVVPELLTGELQRAIHRLHSGESPK